MDYYKIGQRVRKYRKAKNLSQEELAEKIGISVTHMSHIETGNTKLSLPVLVDLANELEVQADELLSDAPSGKSSLKNELEAIIDSCSQKETRIILDTVKALKISFDKHL